MYELLYENVFGKITVPNSDPDLVCCYQNFLGLNTKIVSFCQSVSVCEFNVIALTEIWLKNDVKSSELFPTQHNVYRKDRDLKKLI